MTIRAASSPLAAAILAFGLVESGQAIGQVQSLDLDADGVVSYAEMAVLVPGFSERAFDAIDTNGDGVLSFEELTEAVEDGRLSLG